MKSSVDVYEAWHSFETQFGVPAAGHCASVEHAVPELMPSGSASGALIGTCTAPHTGHAPTPEQSGSAQSGRSSQSLSTPSSQTSSCAVHGGASTTAPPEPSSPLSRAPGPHPTREPTPTTTTVISVRILLCPCNERGADHAADHVWTASKICCPDPVSYT